MKDRVYIVTGGSRGFGLAIAKSLVENGARVGLLGRNQAGLNHAVAELGSDNAYGVVSDVATMTATTTATTTATSLTRPTTSADTTGLTGRLVPPERFEQQLDCLLKQARKDGSERLRKMAEQAAPTRPPRPLSISTETFSQHRTQESNIKIYFCL